MRFDGIKLLLPLLALATAHAEYVDAKQCAACHPKIAQTYAKTGMARSFYKLTPPNGVEDFSKGNPFYQKASQTWYAMERRDGAYFQKRWRMGYDGRETDVDELSIDYVMGSGNHVRTYLHRTARGTLIELPLAWYAENGGHWGMNPGHDRNVELPARTVAYECMGCHNAYPRIPAGHDEPGSEYVYTGVLPEGIDCQRCHGPGGDHVRAAKVPGARLADIRRAIVNPARLSSERQLEVCMQCHLETSSQQLPHSLVKYGRGPFSYTPGQSLGNFALFFDRATPNQNFEIAHSAYRLRQSRCFLESKGAMTCTTCHNPHDIPRGNEASAHYNGVCKQCHAATQLSALPAHSTDADCVTCHMPKRRTTDVVNAVMTDHLIQRRALAEPLRALAETHEENARGAVTPYYPGPLPATPENALYVAVAKGLPDLATEVTRQRPARPEFYVELGQALLAAGDKLGAVRALEEAVRIEPRSTVAAISLGDALTQAGNAERAVALLTRALAIAPNDALASYQLGLAYAAAGDGAKAAEALRKTIALDPRMAEAYSELGTAYAAAGDRANAESALRNALRIQPDLADASLVLGQLLTANKDLKQALYYFERAVRADPQLPEAHAYLGTLLEASAQPDRALREFLAAVQLKPDYGMAHLNAGRLLAAKNDPSARQHFEIAARDPDPTISGRALAALQ